MTKESLTKLIIETAEEVIEESISETDFDKPIEDLGIDSLDILEVFTVISKKLSIRVPRDQLMESNTLNEFIDKLLSHQN